MPDPVVAQKEPFAVDVTEGAEYWWCACGRSKNQPFCDSSHKGTGFSPVQFTAERTKTVYFCGCKNSGRKPLCDGTHSRL